MSRAVAGFGTLVLLLGALLATGCGGEPADPFEARAADIERRLLESCSCHPKKIEGLPLETALRQSIRAHLLTGMDDDDVAWLVLKEYGAALLRAGIEDVESRAVAVAVLTPVLLLVGAGVLLLQLRRD